MQDDFSRDPPSTARDDVFTRNAVALRRRARSAERRGLQHLERGLMMSSIEALREAAETYRGLRDTTRSQSTEQYLALAMYEQGEVEEAVQIWEDLIADGWDRPTTLNFLVRHYEELGDAQAVKRVYQRLERSKREGSGFFSEFGGPQDRASASSVRGDTKATLLVADNDPAVRKVLGRVLETEGYKILSAEDGEGALTAVFEGAPDLVFLDIYMPRLSGLDVLYRMRAEGDRTPVIVISGRPHATMVQDSKVLGARFVAKPMDMEEILGMVADLLAEVRP